MRLAVVAVEGPRHRLPNGPPARALPVEAELGRQPVEPVENVRLRGTELERAHDRRDRELALTDERLRIDHEPRLALCRKDVVAVEVLVQQHLLALRLRE